MANSHYVSRLILRNFADDGNVNVFDVKTQEMRKEKVKNICSKNNLYSEDVEKGFATNIEGPFGDLLANRILKYNSFTLSRKDILTIKKYLNMHFLRSLLCSMSKEDQRKLFPKALYGRVKDREWCLDEKTFDTVMSDISVAKSLNGSVNRESPISVLATNLFVSNSEIAFWEAPEGKEFVMPQLAGIVTHNTGSSIRAFQVKLAMKRNLSNLEASYISAYYLNPVNMFGSNVNYIFTAVSPKMGIVLISSFFKLFFAINDKKNYYPSVISAEYFDVNFPERMNMELFRPANNDAFVINRRNVKGYFNTEHAKNFKARYEKKLLNEHEVNIVNEVLINAEYDFFVFHNYEALR